MDVMAEAVDAIQKNLKARMVMGELEHSVDPKIHLDRVSHLMTKVWIENSKVMGELEVLDKMPCGKILMSLIESEIPICISSRGVGDMEPVMTENFGEEAYDVLPGYRFITWDIVAEPSVTEAQLSVMESLQRHKSGYDLDKFVAEFRNALKQLRK